MFTLLYINLILFNVTVCVIRSNKVFIYLFIYLYLITAHYKLCPHKVYNYIYLLYITLRQKFAQVILCVLPSVRAWEFARTCMNMFTFTSLFRRVVQCTVLPITSQKKSSSFSTRSVSAASHYNSVCLDPVPVRQHFTSNFKQSELFPFCCKAIYTCYSGTNYAV